jgi:hypothetical protein
MKMRKKKGSLILPMLALAVFGLTQILNRFPMFVEKHYSQKLYPVVATVFSFISKWFPFSLSDTFYLLLITIVFLVAFLLVIKKISILTSFMVVLNVSAFIYITFYLMWGFNYFRADINSRLDISVRQTVTDEFSTVFRQIVEATNHSYISYDNFSKTETDSHVESTFRRLAPALKINYPMGSRRAKSITFSNFFAQAGISGYYGPFFNEIHINRHLLPEEYGFVLAHEKAHQFGITGEAEANFIAWLVCTHSESDQIRYGANLVALRYFINHGARYEEFRDIIEKLDERVIEDLKKIQRHWMALRNEKVERVASKVNDAYLKTNQVEKGIHDYTGIVRHIMDYSFNPAFRERLSP